MDDQQGRGWPRKLCSSGRIAEQTDLDQVRPRQAEPGKCTLQGRVVPERGLAPLFVDLKPALGDPPEGYHCVADPG